MSSATNYSPHILVFCCLACCSVAPRCHTRNRQCCLIIWSFWCMLFVCLGESWYFIHHFKKVSHGCTWSITSDEFPGKNVPANITMSHSPGPRCFCWVIMQYLWPRKSRRHFDMLMRCKSAHYHLTVFTGGIRLHLLQDIICFKVLFDMFCNVKAYMVFILLVQLCIFSPSSSKNGYFRPSVCLSVCPSVTPFWQCSCYHIIMKFSGVITNDRSDVHANGQGQRSRSQRSWPHLAVSGP